MTISGSTSDPAQATAFGRGNGKTVLLGEHAVVYGIPAIAAGISLGATARAEPAQASSIRIAERSARPGDGSELGRAFEQLCGALRVRPYRVEVEVDLPLGSGLGGSAAIGVAVARALLAASAEPETGARVLQAAAVWERVFHGNASGVDAAAAYFGTCIWFTKAYGPEPIRVKTPLRLALCLAGPPASTKQMVESVRQLGERKPDLLGKSLAGIESLVKNAKLCIEAGDLSSLGQLMNLNQMLLSGLFLSTPEIERACAVAREAGALGAKLTGGGGGGAVIALGQESVAAIESAFRAEGFTAFSAEIAASPAGHP
ncbi:MAG TPA: mevalonate kinase [Polyangiaceae bacterium]|nr:mevalonate kinase [Polyangiaceae bacterium]